MYKHPKIFKLFKYHSFLRKEVGSSSVSLPYWMLEQIESDVEQSSARARANFTIRRDVLFCKIRNNRIRFRCPIRALKNYRTHILLLFFKFLASRFELPDLHFGIFLGDGIEEVPPSIEVPLLTFAKESNYQGPILIPDFEMLQGYQALNLEIEKGIDLHPWEEKISQAFWRGGTAGRYFLGSPDVAKTERQKLVEQSQQYPQEIDAFFTGTPQCSLEYRNFLFEKGLIRSSTSLQDHFKYRYLIDIDGNTCTYSRLYWILRSNSVPLKQKSTSIQWYYRGLKEGENILFFSTQDDSLKRVVDKLQKQDSYACTIAEKSREFAIKYLNVSYACTYVLKVLHSLSEKKRSG